MRIPSKLLTGNKEKDKETVTVLNIVTNLIWQSKRESFQDCELISEQIIMKLFKEGMLIVKEWYEY